MAGRLFVALSLRMLAAMSRFSMSLMKLGISMDTGQPETQPGLAQSQQRRASRTAASTSRPLLTSPKSQFLAPGSRSGIFCRGIFILSLIGVDFRSSFRHSFSYSALSLSLSSAEISCFSVISGSDCASARPLEPLLLEGAKRFHFIIKIGFAAGEKLRPIDGVAIEIRSVNTGKFRLAVRRYPAGTAHARPVDHDRVEADHSLHSRRTGGLGAAVHQIGAADRHHAVDLLLFLDQGIELVGDVFF